MSNEQLDFPFSTDDMRLLFLLSEEQTVKGVAERLGRDQTTVTRQLSQLSQKFPVLQKNNGVWLLTSFGQEVAKFSRRLMNEQRQLIDLPKVIRIATTKEFSEWVLSPLLGKIISTSKSAFQIAVLTEVGPFEKALLDGKIDIVISCGKPVDPLIKFKRMKSFPLVCVHSAPVREKDKITKLMSLPAVEHTGMTIRSLITNQLHYPEVVAQFDHISGVRGACRAGLGWTILPSYSVQKDIKGGDLHEINISELSELKEEFSVWYVRDYSNLEGVVKQIQKAFDSI